MRQRQLLVVLAITVGLWAPREAAALCEAPGPFLGTGPQLPLGCPVHVYFSFFGGGPQMGPPRLTVLRDGAYVELSGDPFSEPKNLRVEETIIDCQLRVISMATSTQTFEHLAITPIGVAVGDRIGVGEGWLVGIEVVAAGPCAPAIEPQIQCTQTPSCFEPPFDDLPHESCAASPGGGLLIGLALLGLRRRRRR